MNPQLLEQAQALWNLDTKIGKFGSRFEIYPYQPAVQVFEQMQRLEEQIPEHSTPNNQEEFFESELKRRLASQNVSLEHFLRGIPYTPEDVIALYGLDKNELNQLRTWLETNKDSARDAIERLFEQTDVALYELDLSSDIPRIRQQAEGYAGTQITNYHQKLGGLFETLTAAGSYLHRITSEPSTNNRSYFQPKTRRLALSMERICYEQEDGTIQLRERELLRLFGHEGMGHALQQVVTSAADLPFFLKQDANATIATEESIALHYEQIIFDDLNKSPKTQKELRISDNFAEIYAEVQDTREINLYKRNLFYYSILTLADKNLGPYNDPETVRKKIELIGDVALMPAYARNIVEHNRYNFDSQGNLGYNLMSEIRYASGAVELSLALFNENGITYDNKVHRSLIDLTFLTGYYTPTGFVQKSTLTAERKLATN